MTKKSIPSATLKEWLFSLLLSTICFKWAVPRYFKSPYLVQSKEYGGVLLKRFNANRFVCATKRVTFVLQRVSRVSMEAFSSERTQRPARRILSSSFGEPGERILLPGTEPLSRLRDEALISLVSSPIGTSRNLLVENFSAVLFTLQSTVQCIVAKIIVQDKIIVRFFTCCWRC